MYELSPKGLHLVVKGIENEEDATILVRKVEQWTKNR
jgi:hypothetical protein